MLHFSTTKIPATVLQTSCCTILHSLSVQIAGEGVKNGESFGGFGEDGYICRESI